MTTHSLVFKWGTSKGRDTHGYTTCTASLDGTRMGSVNGGGYDMKGAAFAELLMKKWGARISNAHMHAHSRMYKSDTPRRYEPMPIDPAKPEQFYGFSATYNPDHTLKSVHLDGACGFESINRFAKHIGLDLKWVASMGKNGPEVYTITDTKH